MHALRARLRDQAARVRGVLEPAGHVGQEEHLVGAERARHRARRLVRVDVVGAALAVGADGRDHRDVVARHVLDHAHVDALDAPHEADVLAARPRAARDPEERAVVAAQPHRRLAVAAQAQHDLLVHLADQHHLRDLHGALVGDAQAADELDRQAEALHVAGYLRAAAVHHDRVQPDVLQQHHVARELLAQRLVLHRRAAVLDHDRAAVELPDVGQRLQQRADVGHLRRHSGRVVRVERHVVVREVREEHLGLAPPRPAARPHTRPQRARTARASSLLVVVERHARRRTPACPRSRRRPPAAARPAALPPAACTIRPQLGSPPCSAAFTSGELATARATVSARARRRRAPARARSARAPSPSRRSSAPAPAAARRAPRRGAARPRSRPPRRTPLSPELIRIAVSLVDSWPSTVMRSKERFTHTPSSRSAVSRERSASVSTKHSIVAKRGEIMPAPLHCALTRTVPDGSSTSRQARFSDAVRRLDRRLEGSTSPSRASCRRASQDPLQDHVHRQVLADRRRSRRAPPAAGSTPAASAGGALRLGRVVEAAPAGGGVRAARVGEHRPQRMQAAALARQQHRRRRRARAGEARRAHRLVASHTSRPTSGLPLGFRPAAHAGRAEARRQPRVARQLAHVLRRRAPSASRSTGLAARRSQQPPRLGQPEHQVQVLQRLRGGALPEVVDRREHQHLAGVRVAPPRTCGRSSSRAPRARRAARPRPPRTAPPRRHRGRARASSPGATLARRA